MSIIYSYPEQGALNANDLLIGTSAEKVGGKQKNITRNFSIQQIADFINSGAGFVDPVASDFQIPVFNQEGKKITGSIMSQDSSPSNGVAGSAITIAGSLVTTGDLTSPGVVTIGGGTNLITLNSETYLKGSLRDSANVLGADKQILLSDQFGYTTWTNYEAGLTYEGTWDASNNTTNGLSNSPALVSGVGVSGHFYIVNVAGNTTLDTNSDWHVGDWAVFLDEGGQPASWQKIDNTSTLTGSGTAGVFAKWTDTTTLNDSLMSQSGTNILINGGLKVKDTVEATTTNSNLKLKGNGTGGVEIMSADGVTDGKIQLNCSVNSHGVTLQSPPHPYASYTLVLPATVGTAGQLLTSGGASPSQLTWTSLPSNIVSGYGTTNTIPIYTNGPSGLIGDSIMSYAGTVISVNGDFSTQGLEVNKYLTDGTGSNGADGQVLTSTTSGADKEILWVNASTIGDTYTLSAGSKSGSSVPLNLDAATGSDSVVNLTEGTGITLTRTSANEITIEGTAQGVTGSGTVNKFPKFGTTTSLTDSLVSETNTNFGTSNIKMTPPSLATGFRCIASNNTFPVTGATLSSVDLSSDPFGVSNLTQLAHFSFRFNSTSDADIFRSKYGIPAGQSGFDSTSFASATTFVFSYSNGATITFTHPAGVIAFNNNNQVILGKAFGELPGPQSYGQELSYVSGAGTITDSGSSTLLNASAGVQVDGIVDMTTHQIKNVLDPTNQQDAATKQYVDTAVSGAVTFKGTFDASTGTITGGTDKLYTTGANTNTIAVAIGDMYIVSTAGNFFANAASPLNVGDEVIATVASTISPSVSQESFYNAVPSAGAGVTDLTNVMGTFVTGTANAAQTGSVSLGTIDLKNNGTGSPTTPDATKFYRGDASWQTVAGYSPWNLSGQTGTAQSIGSGETVAVTSANTAITTSVAATNTLTLTSTPFGGNAIVGHVPDASGAGDNTKFLKGDGTWAEAASTGGSQIDVYTTPSIGTPNGTLQTFGTLGSTNIDNVSQTEVYIDGVYQSTSTYNVSNVSGTTQAGTYITFITPPPTGVDIEIRVVENIIYTNIVTQSFTIPTYVAGNLTAVPFGLYIFTQATSRDLALPINPVAGTSFKVSLRYAEGATTPINRIVRNTTNTTAKIMGQDADLNLDTLPASFEVIWTGSAVANTTFQGWVIVGAGS